MSMQYVFLYSKSTPYIYAPHLSSARTISDLPMKNERLLSKYSYVKSSVRKE